MTSTRSPATARIGFSGDTGLATGAQLSGVQGVSIDSGGSLVLADTGNNRIRFEPQTNTSLFGGGFQEEDHIYTVAGNGSTGFSGDGLPAGETQLSTPVGIALHPSGGIAIADFANNRIRFLAAGAGVFGQAMTAGDLYTIAGNGTGSFGGDGGLGTSAQLSEPEGVAFDGAGRPRDRRPLQPPRALHARQLGFLLRPGDDRQRHLHDRRQRHRRLRRRRRPRDQRRTERAVGRQDRRRTATCSSPTPQNYRVRFIPASSGTFYGQAMTADHIYTIAGNGKDGFSGDGGPATAAELEGVWTSASTPPATLAITDSDNQRVRFIPATSGTFYGQAMTADHIYTIAGNGKARLRRRRRARNRGAARIPARRRPRPRRRSRRSPTRETTACASSPSATAATSACR